MISHKNDQKPFRCTGCLMSEQQSMGCMNLNFQKLGYIVRTINESTVDKLTDEEIGGRHGNDFYCLQLSTDGFTAIIQFAGETIWHSDEWDEPNCIGTDADWQKELKRMERYLIKERDARITILKKLLRRDK